MEEDVLYIKPMTLFERMFHLLRTECTMPLLLEMSSKCHAIGRTCKGDGAGLLSGGIIDLFLTSFLSERLSDFKTCHNGETDLIIHGCPLSLKKISGKSSIALNWSKNKSDVKTDFFQCDIMILNLKAEQWWKKEKPDSVISLTHVIPSGMYFIPKEYCSKIVLSSNNKTDTLISTEQLYGMLTYSMTHNYMIHLPDPDTTVSFNILNAFIKKSV